jgi:clan AA aspartic protease
MIGYVDASGRALLEVKLRAHGGVDESSVVTWIDTGFTGDLVLPDSVIQSLSLTLSGTVSAVLADGSQVAMRTYSCHIDWFGKWQSLEVVASDAQFPILGVGLLLNHSLRIDYATKEITLE